MNRIRRGFHRFGNALAIVVFLFGAGVFGVIGGAAHTAADLQAVMTITAVAALLAYGAVALIGWCVSGFFERD